MSRHQTQERLIFVIEICVFSNKSFQNVFNYITSNTSLFLSLLAFFHLIKRKGNYFEEEIQNTKAQTASY